MDAVFAAPLRGTVGPWPAEWSEAPVLEAARRRLLFHGIGGLLTESRNLLEGWPDSLLEDLRQESLARAMWELRHKPLIAEVGEALHDAGIPSVLLKGTALAYSYYPKPALRFRGDTDLLISERDLAPSRQILPGLGWSRQGHTHGPFGDLHYQEIWQYRDQAGFTHDLDLHWEVTNSLALRHVLDVDQVLADTVPLAGLSPYARSADPVTALIHRAVNRAEHARSGYFSLDRNEYDPDRLIWAVDLDLLARELTTPQWETLTSRSLETGVAAIVGDALGFATRSLGTAAPEGVREKLADASPDTPATRFLTGSRGLARALADLRATPGLVPKLGYILARAVPAAQHLREKYPTMAHWPLALLYLRRLLGGLSGSFRGRAS